MGLAVYNGNFSPARFHWPRSTVTRTVRPGPTRGHWIPRRTSGFIGPGRWRSLRESYSAGHFPPAVFTHWKQADAPRMTISWGPGGDIWPQCAAATN